MKAREMLIEASRERRFKRPDTPLGNLSNELLVMVIHTAKPSHGHEITVTTIGSYGTYPRSFTNETDGPPSRVIREVTF